MYIPSADSNSAFDNLTFRVRYMKRNAMGKLFGDKVGIDFASSSSASRIHDIISWRASDWMEASHLIDFCDFVGRALEDAIIKNLPAGKDCGEAICEDERFIEAVEAEAERIKLGATTEALRAIMRGVETSSNPMTIINSTAKVEAYKKMLEAIGGISSLDSEEVSDIFAGKDRREQERKAKRHEERQITPDKVVLVKVGSIYSLDAYNKNGTFMQRKTLSASRKPDAIAVAREWVEELRIEALAEAKKRGWETENGYDRFNCASPSIEA